MENQNEVEDFNAQEEDEQQLLIEDPKRCLAVSGEYAEDHQKPTHEESTMMTAELLQKIDLERESGGPVATVGAAEPAAAPSSSSAQPDDNENQGEEQAGVAAEADLYQLGGGGPAGDFVPRG